MLVIDLLQMVSSIVFQLYGLYLQIIGLCSLNKVGLYDDAISEQQTTAPVQYSCHNDFDFVHRKRLSDAVSETHMQ